MSDGTFIDSNVFLRHLLNDHPRMSQASRRLLLSVEAGKTPAWTSPTVISEIVWILGSSMYRMPRPEIARVTVALIGLNGLAIEHRAELARACELFESLNIDFADAYHAALLGARGERRLFSYDRDFDKVATLERLEP